ncbi:MAG: N-6 DNA methylase [Cyanobacteria bacterium SZAS-4]|nr:N-6 DNA methylase [Cyanobacteria bacterium SZAS-4]
MSPISEMTQPISLEQARHVAMMKLLRTLRKEFSELRNSDSFFGALIGAVGLAKRGLLPTDLADSKLARFMQAYATKIGAPDARPDRTPFASASVAWIRTGSSTEFESFMEINGDRLVKALNLFHVSAGLDESLAVGWFRQCLVKTIGTEKNVLLDGHRTRARLDDMVQLTQWFTPSWIANFLIEESIADYSEAIFLDPACGAGHLLVPALRRLVELKNRRHETDALSEILEKQLFALDVDKQLVDLAQLAIYLETRDIVGIVDLPVANIHSFDGSEESRALGSLRLGAGSQPAQFPKNFDAIAMNPPYLGHRTMPPLIRDFLKREFPNSQYDLYAAFLELGLRLLKPDGKLSAICQQSVLTIQRYESLRKTIIETADMETVAQLGSGSFATKCGEKTNTAIITVRKRGASKNNDNDVHCWQLLTKKDKITAECTGVRHLPLTSIPRADADLIAKVLPQTPFAYWAPEEILQLFATHAPISDAANGIACTNGLFTCNNKKFVERFDDIAPENRHQYVPYDKGGGYKWYRTSPLMLRWNGDGQEIRDYRIKRGQSAKFPGEQHYFKNGVTYSYIGTRGFKARLLTPNSVFDIASSAVFSEHVDIMFILGFLNSSLVRSILGVLNPTVNFQIGDIRRLPFKIPPTDIEHTVSALVERAVSIAREIETFDPDSPNFHGGISGRYDANPSESLRLHSKQCEQWALEESSIQDRLDEIIFDMYKISSSCRKKIQEDPWVSRGSDAFRKAAFSTV